VLVTCVWLLNDGCSRGAGQKRGVCVLRVAKNVVVVNKKANPGVSFMGYFGCVGRRIETTGIKGPRVAKQNSGWCIAGHTQNSNLGCSTALISFTGSHQKKNSNNRSTTHTVVKNDHIILIIQCMLCCVARKSSNALLLPESLGRRKLLTFCK